MPREYDYSSIVISSNAPKIISLCLYLRLREHFGAGKGTDKVAVTATRAFLDSFGLKLSKVECGRIVKRAFPEVKRQRSNSKWYYYGLQSVDGKAAASSTSSGTCSAHSSCKPSSPKKEATDQDHCEDTALQVAGSDDFIDQQVVSTPNGVHTHGDKNVTQAVCINQQQVDLRPKIVHSRETLPRQQSDFRPFAIPALNLCKEDMSDLTQGQLIGEGTFGRCIAGTYRGVSAAFNVFKHLHRYEEVHAEASILLHIPSHPGIPMLIGVCTTSTPFVLATKLCKHAGEPDTYMSFLKRQEKHSKPNLGLALYLLLSVGEALAHLSSVGILHNDTQGNNVVLEDAPGVKRAVLIDFGKACYAQNEKGIHTCGLRWCSWLLVGTYMLELVTFTFFI